MPLYGYINEALADLTFAEGVDITVGTATGTKIGTATSQLLAFHGSTPTDQCAAYTQTYSTANRTVAAATTATLTNSTTGTAADTLAAGVGQYLLSVPVNLATVADGDVLTALPIPHKFKILSVDAYVTNEVTTASKATSLNVEIDTTNLTGGVVALTSANSGTLGAKIAGSAVTAANTGAAAATISIEASSTTAFAEGEVMVVIAIQNMDTADALATFVREQAALKADDLDNRQTINSIIDDLQEKGLAG